MVGALPVDKNIWWRVSRKGWSSCPSMPGTFQLLPELSLKARGLRAESLGPVVLSFGDQVGLVCGQQVALSPQFCRFTVTSCLRCMREWRKVTLDGPQRRCCPGASH